MSHLERDILKGKFGKNPQLKKEAREEVAEEKIEKKIGKHVKVREMAGKMIGRVKSFFDPVASNRNARYQGAKDTGLSIRQARRFSKGKDFEFRD